MSTKVKRTVTMPKITAKPESDGKEMYLDISNPRWIMNSPQARAALNEEMIAEYAERMKDGELFPPIVVFRHDDTKSDFIGDGNHRIRAAIAAGLMKINATVYPGNIRDALLYSIKSNHQHGVRRTNEDKKNAVRLLLADSEWSQWSSREIARIAGVSHEMVRQHREPAKVDATDNGCQLIEGQKRIGADGKERKLPTRKDDTSVAQQAESSFSQETTTPTNPETRQPEFQSDAPLLEKAPTVQTEVQETHSENILLSKERTTQLRAIVIKCDHLVCQYRHLGPELMVNNSDIIDRMYQLSDILNLVVNKAHE